MTAREDKEHVRVTQAVSDRQIHRESPGFLVPSLALLLYATLLHLFLHSLYCIETLTGSRRSARHNHCHLWGFSSDTSGGGSAFWIMLIYVPITLAARVWHLSGRCLSSHSSTPQVGFCMIYSNNFWVSEANRKYIHKAHHLRKRFYVRPTFKIQISGKFSL